MAYTCTQCNGTHLHGEKCPQAMDIAAALQIVLDLARRSLDSTQHHPRTEARWKAACDIVEDIAQRGMR